MTSDATVSGNEIFSFTDHIQTLFLSRVELSEDTVVVLTRLVESIIPVLIRCCDLDIVLSSEQNTSLNLTLSQLWNKCSKRLRTPIGNILECKLYIDMMYLVCLCLIIYKPGESSDLSKRIIECVLITLEHYVNLDTQKDLEVLIRLTKDAFKHLNIQDLTHLQLKFQLAQLNYFIHQRQFERAKLIQSKITHFPTDVDFNQRFNGLYFKNCTILFESETYQECLYFLRKAFNYIAVAIEQEKDNLKMCCYCLQSKCLMKIDTEDSKRELFLLSSRFQAAFPHDIQAYETIYVQWDYLKIHDVKMRRFFVVLIKSVDLQPNFSRILRIINRANSKYPFVCLFILDQLFFSSFNQQLDQSSLESVFITRILICMNNGFWYNTPDAMVDSLRQFVLVISDRLSQRLSPNIKHKGGMDICQKGHHLFWDNKFKAAEDLFKIALLPFFDTKENWKIVKRIAWCEIQQEKYDQAKQTLHSMNEEDFSHPLTQFCLFHILMFQRAPIQAMEVLEGIMKIKGEDYIPIVFLCLSKYRSVVCQHSKVVPIVSELLLEMSVGIKESYKDVLRGKDFVSHAVTIAICHIVKYMNLEKPQCSVAVNLILQDFLSIENIKDYCFESFCQWICRRCYEMAVDYHDERMLPEAKMFIETSSRLFETLIQDKTGDMLVLYVEIEHLAMQIEEAYLYDGLNVLHERTWMRIYQSAVRILQQLPAVVLFPNTKAYMDIILYKLICEFRLRREEEMVQTIKQVTELPVPVKYRSFVLGYFVDTLNVAKEVEALSYIFYHETLMQVINKCLDKADFSQGLLSWIRWEFEYLPETHTAMGRWMPSFYSYLRRQPDVPENELKQIVVACWNFGLEQADNEEFDDFDYGKEWCHKAIDIAYFVDESYQQHFVRMWHRVEQEKNRSTPNRSE